MPEDASWLEAPVIGLLQGISELFPASSLGHSVLIPAVLGGSWARDLNVGAPESPYLAFIVGLQVATAIGLIVYFWRDWLRIVAGFFSSVQYRRVSTPDERLAWLLILGTIPIGVAGLALEHLFRTTFSKPSLAAIFLMLNGLILLAAERFRRRAEVAASAMATSVRAVETDPSDRAVPGENSDLDAAVSGMSFRRALGIGSSQIVALLPGISRSGVAMSVGLWRGMTHREAARFSFLLATPVIFAAGALKIPDLMGPLGDGIRPQVLLGSVLSGIGAYVAVRFLERYFTKYTLRPFGYYCLAVGPVRAVLDQPEMRAGTLIQSPPRLPAPDSDGGLACVGRPVWRLVWSGSAWQCARHGVHYFMQSDVAAARLMVRLRARGYDVAVTSAARGHVAYRPTQCPSLRP